MNMKRMRGRNNRGGGNGGGGSSNIRHHNGNIPLNRNHVFDSSGPDLRVRGTAQQLFEKYLQLGRDATSGGDRVMAESYFQHAEHYFRILNAINQATQQQHQPGQNQGGQQNGNYASGNQNGPRRGDNDFENDALEDALNGGGNDQPAEVREIPVLALPVEAGAE